MRTNEVLLLGLQTEWVPFLGEGECAAPAGFCIRLQMWDAP